MIEAFEIRRILVALDASALGDAALAAAFGLASRLGAALEGIFVEDVNLARVAEYGFALHVSRATGRAEPMNVELVQATVRMQTTRIRRTLTTMTHRAGIECAFRVVKGSVPSALLEAAADADLLVLGTRSGAIPSGLVRQVLRIGSTAWAMAERAPRSVLLFRGSAIFGGPVTVVFDGSEGSRRALAAALGLARAGDVPVHVLLPRGEAATDLGIERQVDEIAIHSGVLPTLRYLPRASVRHICDLTEGSRGGLLAISTDSPLLAGEERRSLLENASCAVLLVR